MVSTVSHELKTPLTSVQMAIHLLLEEVVGPLTPKQVELLLAARQDSDRILAMINDLLDLTRIEQGRVKLDLQPSTRLGSRRRCRRPVPARRRQMPGSRSTTQLDGDLPDRPGRSRPDRACLRQSDRQRDPAHARGGTIRIEAAADGERVRFAVEDSGEGIPAEHAPAGLREVLSSTDFAAPGRRRARAWRSCARSFGPWRPDRGPAVSPAKGPRSRSPCLPAPIPWPLI